MNKLEFGERPCWTQLSDLEALGFEILSLIPSLRTVRKGGETFVEGCLQSEIVQTRDVLGLAISAALNATTAGTPSAPEGSSRVAAANLFAASRTAERSAGDL